MRLSIGAKIGSGFGFGLAILIVLGVLAYGSTTALIGATQWVEHSHEVMGNLQDIIQALTDMETGQRGFIITGDDAYLEPYTSGTASIDTLLKELKELTADNPGQRKNLEELTALVTTRAGQITSGIDFRRKNGFAATQTAMLRGVGKQAMDAVRHKIAQMNDEEERLIAAREAASQRDADRTLFVVMAGIPAAIVLLALVAILVVRNITAPLGHLTRMAEKVARGDLADSGRLRERKDEIGVLGHAFDVMTGYLRDMAEAAGRIAQGNLAVRVAPLSDADILGNAFATMTANLRVMSQDLREGIGTLETSASEILATTTQIASGAAQTATGVSETTTTVEEVKQTAQMANQKARVVMEGAQRSVQTAQKGRKAVEEMLEGMNRIREQMDFIASSIVRLSEQSHAIGEIIATVSDLAEQSNLLAVNAGIEAAKAGDQGKGFAVVAQEVKSLAERSRQATAQVRGILGEIQKATSSAVMAAEQGSKVVEAGVKQSAEAGEAIQLLGEGIGEAAQASTQIAASGQQQMVGMEQVAQAMESIKVATAQNVAGTKQAEAAARQLHELGEMLARLVSRYHLEDTVDARAG
ncbi:MAG TPA: CHASE3 domain-containing protein [Spirochaetia bacterium]